MSRRGKVQICGGGRGEEGLGGRTRGEGGEGVRLREDEEREAREGVCVQERESTDMWGWEGEDGLGGGRRLGRENERGGRRGSKIEGG